MSDLTPFEKEIKQTYHLPHVDPAFFTHLEVKLQTYQPTPKVKAKPTLYFVRSWAYAIVILVLVGVMALSLVPSKVLAQIQAIFGFVPGPGLMDTSLPLRQLVAPVSDTKDGVTLTIQSAFLSANQTIITYVMSSLPAEIKRTNFGDPECSTPAYLSLPDGSKVEAPVSSGGLTLDGSFVHEIRFIGSFPTNLNHAALVFPCLEGTALGKGPENWQIALAFKAVPADIVVYPAALLTPQVKVEDSVSASIESSAQPKAENKLSIMPAMIVDGDRQEEMVVLGVVEQPDAYWVTWAYPNKHNSKVQVDGHLYLAPFNPILYDANGLELPEPDHKTQLDLWKYEEGLRSQLSDQDQMKYNGSLHTFVVPKSGIAFPVYAKQNVYERSFPEKEAYTEIKLDGNEVQTADKPVEINREVQIGAVKFKLNAIEKNPFGGYSFLFDGTQGKVIQCAVELVGQPTNMSGGESFNPDDPYHFQVSMMYSQIPTGTLTIRVSQPAVLGDLISFIGSWLPGESPLSEKQTK